MTKIVCKWAKVSKFLVNPDGQVWPCCYLANPGYKQYITGMRDRPEVVARGVDDIVHPIINEYFEHKDELNVTNKPIEEILSHEWFTKTLPESWESDRPHRQCVVMCETTDE